MAKAKTNSALIKQAVLAAQANRRQSTSHAKTRGEVSGGGRKPWKQKGTGRARAGSSRSPIWVGGGIVFGPSKERNYKTNLPKKMARQALVELLNHLNEEKRIVITGSLSLKEVKTKKVAELLKSHNLTNKKVTLVTAQIEPELIVSARNIPGVTVVENRNLSILDLAEVQALLFDQASAEARGLVKKIETPAKPAAKTAAKKTTK